MSKGISANVGGSYQQAKASYVNVNGTWTKFGSTSGNAVIENTPTKTYTSGDTTFHVFEFKESGTLDVLKPGLLQVLIVAGGGAKYDGGGGAGGMLETGVYVEAGSYPITVGAGSGAQGKDSSAFGITARGGGRGGNYNQNPPPQGGGSGGGCGAEGSPHPGGGSLAWPGWPERQGHNGGGGDNNNVSGGGGGAGGAGTSGGGKTGVGGIGRYSSINGENLMYAHGGTAVYGSTPSTYRLGDNTGNGGTGGNGGGAGKSGIVIVRVAV